MILVLCPFNLQYYLLLCLCCNSLKVVVCYRFYLCRIWLHLGLLFIGFSVGLLTQLKSLNTLLQRITCYKVLINKPGLFTFVFQLLTMVKALGTLANQGLGSYFSGIFLIFTVKLIGFLICFFILRIIPSRTLLLLNIVL